MPSNCESATAGVDCSGNERNPEGNGIDCSGNERNPEGSGSPSLTTRKKRGINRDFPENHHQKKIMFNNQKNKKKSNIEAIETSK
jgi:hypothetical protein